MQQFDRVKVTSAKTVSKVPPEGPVLQELLGRDRAVKTTHKTLAQIVCEVQKNIVKRPCLSLANSTLPAIYPTLRFTPHPLRHTHFFNHGQPLANHT